MNSTVYFFPVSIDTFLILSHLFISSTTFPGHQFLWTEFLEVVNFSSLRTRPVPYPSSVKEVSEHPKRKAELTLSLSDFLKVRISLSHCSSLNDNKVEFVLFYPALNVTTGTSIYLPLNFI